jgi:hypothetical protein
MNYAIGLPFLFVFTLFFHSPYAHADQYNNIFIYSTNATSVTIEGLTEGVRDLKAEIVIPDSIQGKPVTHLQRDAFSDAQLTAITIPNSVTNIGSGVFYNCTNLATIHWGHGLTYLSAALFYNCTSLTNIVLPSEIKTIGEGTFNACSGLTNITLTAVTTITGGAFGCEKLTAVFIPSCMISMSRHAFRGCGNLLTIDVATNNPYFSSVNGVLCNKSRQTIIDYPKGRQGAYLAHPEALYVGEYAFFRCQGLSEAVFPQTLFSIGENAFYGCRGMTNIVLGASLNSIGIAAFYGCDALTSITLPSTLSAIYPNAFDSCSGLRSLTLPESLTSIGVGAFKNCCALTTLTIPNNVGALGDYAFYMCTGLQTITLGRAMDYIGSEAFAFCSNLKTLQFEGNAPSTLKNNILSGSTNAVATYWSGTTGWQGVTNLTIRPQPFQYAIQGSTAVVTGYTGRDGVVAIPVTIEGYPVSSVEDYSFMDQTNITAVILSPAVTYVGDFAFARCAKLTGITLSPALTYIGEGAFNQCSSLTNILIPDGVASLGYGVFAECKSLTQASLGKALTAVTSDAFSGCSRLLTIAVNDENPALLSQDGVLFARAPRTLLIYPAGRTGGYHIPEGVQHIGMRAFATAQADHIVLPSTVQTIDGYAFWGCTNLNRVVLSASLSTIGDRAFAQCPALLRVFCPSTPPTVGTAVFDTTHATQLYYLANAPGWPSNYAGLPTALWNPTLNITTTPSRTITVKEYDGMRIVLETSTNLTHWTALSTNLLVGGTHTFTPQGDQHAARFYRAVEYAE